MVMVWGCALKEAPMVCNCKHKEEPKEAPKMILPLPGDIDIENLQNCMIDASFSPDDFNWKKRTLKLTILEIERYRIADVKGLQVGDTIMTAFEPIVVEQIDTLSSRPADGQLRFNGCRSFWPTKSFYRANPTDSTCYVGNSECIAHASYRVVGTVELPLAKDFVISDHLTSSDSVSTNQRQYLESLEGGEREFCGPYGCCMPFTTVTIKDGIITQIVRR